MKVLLLLGDQAGCGFYRMSEPARAVSDAFGDVETIVATQLNVGRLRNGTIAAVDPGGADVVVMQRPATPDLLRSLRLLQRQGVPVVVEVDDLMSATPTAHIGHRVLRDVAGIVAQCADEADHVTVTTPALLAHYARHGRGTVVPNAIPRRFAELWPAYERHTTPVGVGWTGQIPSHPHDLLALGSGLRQAFDHVGDRARFVTWNVLGVAEQTGVQPVNVGARRDVGDYLNSIGEHLDVGIAPLADTRFNRAKSWLKPLEYAARGVLPISSRFGEYVRLGIGPTAKRPRDWAALVTRAVTDDDWRREQAEQAHRAVLDAHLTEHTAHLWMAAWKQAADSRAVA